MEKTNSTLRFGLNAKKIENNVRRNIIAEHNDEALKNIIKEYEKKIMSME
jgi:kinesin family protein 5